MNKTVNIHDIVPYVREMIDRDEWPVNTQEKIINALEIVIDDLGTPDMTMEESYERGEHARQHYDSTFLKYDESAVNFNKLMRLGYFFARGNCYQFDQLIEVPKDHEHHSLMFVLMLNQYAEKLVNLDFFLEYQNQENFKGNTQEFARFLRLLGRQYEYLLDKSVFTSVEEWIDQDLKKDENNAENPVNTGKREKEHSDTYHSFKLIALESDPDYFIKRVSDLLKTVNALKKNRFVHDETTVNHIKGLLSNQPFKKRDRIVWIGTIVELTWFVKYLVYESQKVKPLGNDVWLVTCACFVDQNGQTFRPEQFRTAKGNKVNRRNLLREILSIL